MTDSPSFFFLNGTNGRRLAFWPSCFVYHFSPARLSNRHQRNEEPQRKSQTQPLPLCFVDVKITTNAKFMGIQRHRNFLSPLPTYTWTDRRSDGSASNMLTQYVHGASNRGWRVLLIFYLIYLLHTLSTAVQSTLPTSHTLYVLSGGQALIDGGQFFKYFRPVNQPSIEGIESVSFFSSFIFPVRI